MSDKKWFNTLEDEYIEVPKNFITIETVTREHIKNIVSKMGKVTDDFNLSVAEQKMYSIKKQVRAICKMQLDSWIQMKCKELKLCFPGDNRRVKNMRDLKLLFKNDGSDENCVMMWNIFIGQFELKKPCPFKTFEQDYLEHCKWKYSNLESDQSLLSGFIEKIIKQQKREKIKILNNAGRKTHGKTITTRRPSCMITEENKYDKRVKGVCNLEYMVKYVVSTVYICIYFLITNDNHC